MDNTLIETMFKVNTLIGIEVHDRKQTSLEYKPFKKNWLFGDQKEGFYETYSSHCYSVEGVKEGDYCGIPLVVIDNYDNPGKNIVVIGPNYTAYYKARVKFIFTEGRKFTQFFDTKEEAEKVAKDWKCKMPMMEGSGRFIDFKSNY